MIAASLPSVVFSPGKTHSLLRRNEVLVGTRELRRNEVLVGTRELRRNEVLVGTRERSEHYTARAQRVPLPATAAAGHRLSSHRTAHPGTNSSVAIQDDAPQEAPVSKFKRKATCSCCSRNAGVEVAVPEDGTVAVPVRDAKDSNKAPQTSRVEWAVFIGGVKVGDFDRLLLGALVVYLRIRGVI
jgi:hypothetical protein